MAAMTESVTVHVKPELDQAAKDALSAAVSGLVLDAVQDALHQLACAVALSPDETQLVENYRRSSDMHRVAAQRTLERSSGNTDG